MTLHRSHSTFWRGADTHIGCSHAVGCASASASASKALVGQGGQPVLIARLAFPDGNHMPCSGPQCVHDGPVALGGPAKLRLPEGGVRGWRRAVFTSLVAVPKAAAHHDHNTKAREDQVWRTREVPAMQPEAVTERVG